MVTRKCFTFRESGMFSNNLLFVYQKNRILSHSLTDGLYCGDINGEIPLVQPSSLRQDDTVTYSRWYPFDTGLFSRIVEKRAWQLIDTEAFEELLRIRGDFTH